MQMSKRDDIIYIHKYISFMSIILESPIFTPIPIFELDYFFPFFGKPTKKLFKDPFFSALRNLFLGQKCKTSGNFGFTTFTPIFCSMAFNVCLLSKLIKFSFFAQTSSTNHSKRKGRLGVVTLFEQFT